MPTQSAPGDERNRPIFRLRGEFAETSDLAVTSFDGAGRARRHLGQVGGARGIQTEGNEGFSQTGIRTPIELGSRAGILAVSLHKTTQYQLEIGRVRPP